MNYKKKKKKWVGNQLNASCTAWTRIQKRHVRTQNRTPNILVLHDTLKTVKLPSLDFLIGQGQIRDIFESACLGSGLLQGYRFFLSKMSYDAAFPR